MNAVKGVNASDAPSYLPSQGNDANWGLASHTIVTTRDYFLTDYGKR